MPGTGGWNEHMMWIHGGGAMEADHRSGGGRATEPGPQSWGCEGEAAEPSRRSQSNRTGVAEKRGPNQGGSARAAK